MCPDDRFRRRLQLLTIWEQPRVSHDPLSCGPGMCIPALPGPCSHHGAQDREAAKLPGRFSCSTVLTALIDPVSSMIDKVLLSGVSAADRGWQIPWSSWESIYKKAQKATECPMGRSQAFCAFIFVFIPFSHVIATLRSDSWPILFPQMTLSYHGSRSFLRAAQRADCLLVAFLPP